MSGEAITAAFFLEGLSPTETLVLVAIANYANEEWQCFPSKGRIQQMTKLSARAITNSLASLEAAGIIRREARIRSNGSQTSNLFTLHLGGASGAPTPLQPVPPPGAGGAPPEPEKEPKRKGTELAVRDPFDAWWDVYPRHVAKEGARKAWAKVPKALAADKLDLAHLMERTSAYADHVVGKDPEHVAHPATWLNGKRWNDELPARSQTDGRTTNRLDRAADQHTARVEAMLSGGVEAINRRRRWTLGG